MREGGRERVPGFLRPDKHTVSPLDEQTYFLNRHIKANKGHTQHTL